MQWTGDNSIDEILNQKVDIEYHIMEEQEAWKAEMIKEVIDAKEGYADLALDYEQMAQILEYLCTGWVFSPIRFSFCPGAVFNKVLIKLL